MSVSIYVGNLSFSTDRNELQNLFSNYGQVISAHIISDRETGQSRGFGFVEMEDESAAQAAIAALNGADHNGRNLKVNVSQPKPQRNEGFGGGGGGRRRY